MNTPAHLALSIFLWRKQTQWAAVTAICFGALLPDLPMIGFYLYQKLWAGSSELQIWSQQYFQTDWQLFFDLFNSIPLFLAVLITSYFLNNRVLFLIVASALLHMMLDLPLHHDDAHRHFLPISQWRFESPLSYWDPKYFGHIIFRIELLSSLVICLYVGWKGQGLPIRIVAFLTLGMYQFFIVYAMTSWS